MKKVLALTLALCMVFALCACSVTTSAPKAEEKPAVKAPGVTYDGVAHPIEVLVEVRDNNGVLEAHNLHPLFEGIIKIVLLILYMWVVSKQSDIHRVFQYHGAEHKTIFCYEQGLELTVENVRRQSRFHPRCGTSFLILMLLVSIVVNMFIPATIVDHKILNIVARTGIGLITLPFIMGIGYELIRFAGRHDNLFTRIISAPGVWLQHITTKEPDDSMIECAIAAVKEVIPEDGSDNW